MNGSNSAIIRLRGIAPNLQNFFDRDGLEPAQFHAACLLLGHIDGNELHENVLERGMDALDAA